MPISGAPAPTERKRSSIKEQHHAKCSLPLSPNNWAVAASAMNFHTHPAASASNVVNSLWGMQITWFPPSQQYGSSQCHRIWLCDRWFQTFCPPGSKGVQNKALCAYIMWPDTRAVSSGRFLRAREIGKAVHQMLQPVVDGPRLPSNALARESHLRSKTTAPCLQTWHPRSEPSARKLSPDRGKKGCSKLARNKPSEFWGPKNGVRLSA